MAKTKLTPEQAKERRKENHKRHRDKHKAERNARSRQYYKDHKDERRKYSSKYYKEHSKEQAQRSYIFKLKKDYGLTELEYNNILLKQNNCCAICGIEVNKLNRRPSIDHNHTTNKVRGILCLSCNHLLGNAKENINILLSAIEYLKLHSSND